MCVLGSTPGLIGWSLWGRSLKPCDRPLEPEDMQDVHFADLLLEDDKGPFLALVQRIREHKWPGENVARFPDRFNSAVATATASATQWRLDSDSSVGPRNFAHSDVLLVLRTCGNEPSPRTPAVVYIRVIPQLSLHLLHPSQVDDKRDRDFSEWLRKKITINEFSPLIRTPWHSFQGAQGTHFLSS